MLHSLKDDVELCHAQNSHFLDDQQVDHLVKVIHQDHQVRLLNVIQCFHRFQNIHLLTL